VSLNDGKATVKLESIEFVKDGIFNEASIETTDLTPTPVEE
jgi:hypothetical protein